VLAEIHGKFDTSSATPVARSEDLLTDAVFGAVRHLPRSLVLLGLLRLAGCDIAPGRANDAQILFWPTYPMPGAPGVVIEPDVVVIADGKIVVFEAKLFSPFGEYGSLAPDGGQPVHQLAVQYAAVAAYAASYGLPPPIMVAVTAGRSRPSTDLDRAAVDIERLTGCAPATNPVWLPWHHIARLLEATEGLRTHERALVDDTLALMERRGVRQLFDKVQMDDFWLLTAAQHAAADRLYPKLRSFFDDLTGILDEDGIGWSQASYKGMWLGGASTSVSKPTEWTRSFVGAQYWPKAWPSRGKAGTNLALYCLFDFVDPAVEIGLSIPGPGSAAAQEKWAPYATTLADVARDNDLEVRIDVGDIAKPRHSVRSTDVTDEWLTSRYSDLIGTAHFRLCTRLEVQSITVEAARQAIGSLKTTLESAPKVFEMAASTGHVELSAT
jgi:hypothetical protein